MKREVCKLFARPSGHIRDNLSGVNLQRKESGPPPDNISSGIRTEQHSVEKEEEKKLGRVKKLNFVFFLHYKIISNIYLFYDKA